VTLVASGVSGLGEVQGNGDALVDPGETWEFSPQMRNSACSTTAIGVSARVEVNAGSTGGVVVLNPVVAFGDVAPGAVASSLAPVRFRVSSGTACGALLLFDVVDIAAANGGPFPDALAVIATEVGEEPVSTIFHDDFAPPTWSTVNGGTGGGPAATWTASNPGGRSLSLTAPFYIADSDELGSGFSMDEQLIGPAVDVSGYSGVLLQFTHEFNWYEGGNDEQCDIDVRSSATGGAWVNVAKFEDGDTSGVVTVDITAQAAGQSNVQVRFHYYNAVFEWWWAVDDVFLLGTNGYVCDPQGGPRVRPAGGGPYTDADRE
jgi:hypothetical protein